MKSFSFCKLKSGALALFPHLTPLLWGRSSPSSLLLRPAHPCSLGGARVVLWVPGTLGAPPPGTKGVSACVLGISPVPHDAQDAPSPNGDEHPAEMPTPEPALCRCLLPSFTETSQERSLRPASAFPGCRRCLIPPGGLFPPSSLLVVLQTRPPKAEGPAAARVLGLRPGSQGFSPAPPAARPLHKGGCGRCGAVALPPPARSPRSPPPWAAPRRSASSSSSPPSCRPPGPAEPVRWGGGGGDWG